MVVWVLQELISFYGDVKLAFQRIGISDILDILIVTFLIYKVITLVHSTSASRVGKGIILLLLITLLSDVLKLNVLNFVLSNILELGFIALVIMFQPELRRALEHFGGKNMVKALVGSGEAVPKTELEQAILATVSACEIMSRERVGVLLVFERQTSLEDYFKTGTLIDAKMSEQLLRNLFFPKASLHDGAVIVREGRVAAAGCVMPLSENPHLNSDLGTRHRAGIGTSEVSDAVVVIVSEETGTISVAIGGMLKRHLALQTLERLLTSELIANEEAGSTLLTKLRQHLTGRKRNHAK